MEGHVCVPGSIGCEFPDYPPEDLPAVPDWLVPCFWHNDTCPVWGDAAYVGGELHGLAFSADYADPSRSEFPESAAEHRFHAWRMERGEQAEVCSGPEPGPVLEWLEQRRRAR